MTSENELTGRLDSVPVVMICFNGLYRRHLPQGITIVNERSADEKRTGQSGRIVLEGRGVNHSRTLELLADHGYHPVRALAVLRRRGQFRVVVVCPHWKHVQDGDERLRGTMYRQIVAMLDQFWDSRMFRNSSLEGGNFILDLGIPSDQGEFFMRINDQLEFHLTDRASEEAAYNALLKAAERLAARL